MQSQEDLLRLLIESAKDYAIFTHDNERRVNTWNKGAELMFGYTEEEILGQSADIFFVPEDRENGVPIQETEKAATTGSAENERWHLRRNGSRFYGSGMVRPLYDQSKSLIGFVKIMRDLTQNKQAEDALRENEERLRITVNSAIDYAIITIDVNGNIVGWSKGAELIFGYKEPEVLGMHTELIFTPEDRAAGAPQQEMETAVREGRANDERWHERKDKTRFYMSGVMTPIIYNSRLAGFVKVARNMTDRKLIEQQKDEFIGVASHELKTPVTSIKSYTELLLEMASHPQDKDFPEMVAKLDTQVNRLIDLINALLDTTRIAESRMDLYTTTFDLNTLIEERVREIQSVSKNYQIHFNQGTLKEVTADRQRIGQVVTNLLSNAIKYSPEGSKVIITSSMLNNAAVVTVQDFGIGIPADVASKIFERFFRVPHQSLTKYPGMGLGLYIASEIMKMHGGFIGVESDVSPGSLFRFTLPYK